MTESDPHQRAVGQPELEALRESEELHRVTLESISDAIFITDDLGRFCYICGNIRLIFGHTVEQIRQMGNVRDLLGASLVDPQELSGERSNIECRITDDRGAAHDLLINVKRVSIQGGTILYSCRDITQRRQAQAAEDELGRILDDSLNEIYVFDAESLKFLRVNRGARVNLQYSMDEMRDLTPIDLKPEYDRDSFANLLRPIRAGEKITFQTVHRRKDHSLYDVEVHLQHATYHGRSVFVAIVLDTTRRRRVEKALLEREQRLAAILAAAVDAIVIIDAQGTITQVNVATERMFGYSQSELIDQNVSVLMPKPYCDEHDAYIARYLATRQPHVIGVGREVVALRKDGTTFPADLSISEVDDLHLFTGVIRDITERKELQRQILEIAVDEQRRIGQELHDGTQQELTGLSLMAQNLVDTINRLGEDFLEQHDLQNLRRVATRLSDGLSDTNKSVQMISRGLIPVEVDSRGLMTALDELAYGISEVHSLNCSFVCGQPVELADNFVATHLYRIAQEAVTNALKHGQPEGIEIWLSATDSSVMLRVVDNGTGIADRRAGHAGRGLKIMGYRASLIGATLQVGRAENGGTQVTCVVPV